MNILDIGIVVFICSVLAILTYRRGMLNKGGSLTAWILGIIIGLEGGLLWIFLLLIFLFSAFLATKYKFKVKLKRGVQEGKKGERGAINVIGNGIIPVMIAILKNPGGLFNYGVFDENLALILFITSVSAAAADTLASEMGLLSDKTYLITNLKRVKPGTNGGISIYGEIWSFIGSAYTFLIAFTLFTVLNGKPFSFPIAILGILFGFMSCQIDSILGATLERKNYISKSTVNLTAISITVTIFGVILWMIRF
ncbi:MAG: DUF92 domain-containing protein [Thermoplasmatota archaeon]